MAETRDMTALVTFGPTPRLAAWGRGPETKEAGNVHAIR